DMGLLSKVVASAISKTLLTPILGWLRTRRIVKSVEGVYVAENIEGRIRVPMRGAGLTIISSRQLWCLDYSALDVFGYDTDSRRGHQGEMRIQPGGRTAERLGDYVGCDERFRQCVEFANCFRDLWIYPQDPAYDRHVLRRARGILLLS